MSAMSYPLDPTPEQMREMGRAALDYLVEFTASQDEQTALDVEGAIDAARSVRAAPPQDGGNFDRLMDQVDLIAKQLKTLGVAVDLAAHFGFIRRWQLVGPFDHSKGVGFAAVYPPEKGVTLTTSYQGKNAAGQRGYGQQLNHAHQWETNRQCDQQLDIAAANPSPLVYD